MKRPVSIRPFQITFFCAGASVRLRIIAFLKISNNFMSRWFSHSIHGELKIECFSISSSFFLGKISQNRKKIQNFSKNDIVFKKVRQLPYDIIEISEKNSLFLSLLSLFLGFLSSIMGASFELGNSKNAQVRRNDTNTPIAFQILYKKHPIDRLKVKKLKS